MFNQVWIRTDAESMIKKLSTYLTTTESPLKILKLLSDTGVQSSINKFKNDHMGKHIKLLVYKTEKYKFSEDYVVGFTHLGSIISVVISSPHYNYRIFIGEELEDKSASNPKGFTNFGQSEKLVSKEIVKLSEECYDS